jgi:hypothetical protein
VLLRLQRRELGARRGRGRLRRLCADGHGAQALVGGAGGPGGGAPAALGRRTVAG